jgi:hypothetical protein
MESKNNALTIILTIIITAIIVGGGMYFLQQKEISDQNPTQQNSTITNTPAPATKSNLYTDEKSGISFTVPTGWVVSTDEVGDLYMYRQKPYITVSFRTFADKDSLQKRIDEWNGEITKGNTTQKDSTIGGLSAKLLETGINGNYYVDSGTNWFEISTADQNSAEITAIIQSIKF